MKKLAAILLACAMLFGAVACSADNGAGDENVTTPLSEIMDSILKDSGTDELATANNTVTDDRFSWFFGIDPIEGAEAYSSEALINAVAHSVALLRVPEGTDATALAETIKASLNPRQWICVEAEKTIVSVHGNIILAVMSSEKTADAIAANFDAFFHK